MEKKLFEKIDNYIGDLLAPEDPVLQSIEKSLETANIPQQSIYPNQGKLLQLFVKLSKAKRILEIGTLGGYSTIWLARVLPDDGKIITIELNEDYAKVAQQNIKKAGMQKNVEIRIGEALDVLSQLNDEHVEAFDIVFLDAHKPSYIQYFEWALSHTKMGSLIIADNVIRNGEVLKKNCTDEKVIGVQKFNKMLSENKRVFSTIITNASGNGFDGMSISVVRQPMCQ